MYFPSVELVQQYGIAHILQSLGLSHMLPLYGAFPPAISQGIPYLCESDEARSLATALRRYARALYTGIVHTRGDLVFSKIAPMALEAIANGFVSERTGRPDISLSMIFECLDVQPFLWWHSTKNRRDVLSGEGLREVIAHRFEAFPRRLALSLARWEHNGQILWSDEAEKQTAMNVLNCCMSPAMRIFMDHLWKETGGDETFDKVIWPRFLTQMASYDFATKFAQGCFGEPIRHGIDPYQSFFDTLGFGSSIQDFYDYTKNISIPLLQQAITKVVRLSNRVDLSLPPPDNALAFFSSAIPQALEILAKYGLIPEADTKDARWYVIQEMPPTLCVLVPAAIGMTPPQIHHACGLYGINPQRSPEELAKRGSPIPSAMHELTHVWSGVLAPSLLPPEVVHFWQASTITQESCALLAELLYVLERPTASSAKWFLEMMLLRDARLVAEVDFHVNGASFEDILTYYTHHDPFSADHAKKDIIRACFGTPLSFAGYAVGRHSLMSCQNLTQMCAYNRREGGWILPQMSFTLNPSGEAYDCLQNPTEWMISTLMEAMQ